MNQVVLDDNKTIFWHVFFDDEDFDRLIVAMEDIKDILAEYGNVCIQIKPHADDCYDMKLFEDSNDDEYIDYLSSLLKNGAEYAIKNIDADETMKDVMVISEPVETYDSELGWNFKFYLTLV